MMLFTVAFLPCCQKRVSPVSDPYLSFNVCIYPSGYDDDIQFVFLRSTFVGSVWIWTVTVAFYPLSYALAMPLSPD